MMRVSLRYGILGLLSKWEASGYDIKKEFDDVMSIFWHTHLSQIYPELNKLENEKLVVSLFHRMGNQIKRFILLRKMEEKFYSNGCLSHTKHQK